MARKTISMRLSTASIDAAIKEVKAYRDSLNQKAILLAQKLAEAGYQCAKITMSEHVFSGDTLASLHVEDYGGGRMALVAGSEALLFFEFGAGIKMGGGHPLNDKLGMGPGTYPGKGHWDDPDGWWYYDDYGVKHHTFGNQPHMPMYKASVEMRANIERIAREVFR